jgi:hypothetical protein
MTTDAPTPGSTLNAVEHVTWVPSPIATATVYLVTSSDGDVLYRGGDMGLADEICACYGAHMCGLCAQGSLGGAA